ncbi:hypothetical protein [Streptomyces sp. NK15101]|nr:hypothetical protein [Streptomyces sp. NK15101]
MARRRTSKHEGNDQGSGLAKAQFLIDLLAVLVAIASCVEQLAR